MHSHTAKPEAPRELLTVEAAARRLSIGRTTMYALIKTGQILTVRVGRLRRVPADALTAYVRQLAHTQHTSHTAA
ncbi:helix-turn-helix domain-containing protein [Amycolatopsis suaedae]|uniref:DNA-binding protein n=1 Tax=Amycolatopsis suaedae TaxID=2510978 RepID=A0A4Q7JBJ8_9PSEU|nr:helix-turn-helix domain-containing protein [Amycolatopsis suaedae]RZQ64372.1 DNA-binding protein [Amycolatopsis suaedae]